MTDTRSYDAWSEFEPDAAAAIQYAIRTGDWSNIAEYDPELANALRYAVHDGDWRPFDPHVAVALRAAIGQDHINQQVEEDRALAVDLRQLAAKYPDFGANQQAVLEYAVKNGLNSPELAYKAWTSASGRLQTSAAAAKAAQPNPANARIEKIEARLDEIKYRDDMSANRERNALQQELKEAQNEGAGELFRGNQEEGDPTAEAFINTYNEAKNNRDRSRATRLQFGHDERNAPAMTREMKYAIADAQALALFRAAEGGKDKERAFIAELQPKAPKKSRTQSIDPRGDYAKDDRDRALIGALKQQNDTRRASEASNEPQNANDAIAQIASENEME